MVRAGAQRVGLMADDVQEVQRVVAWEPLPGAPPAVEGVIDLRGDIVAVLDLAERLGEPAQPAALTDHLVIARTDRHRVAIRVQQAQGMASLSPADLDAGDPLPPAQRVRGVVRLPDALLVIVDLAALLGWEEADALDRALADRGPEVQVG